MSDLLIKNMEMPKERKMFVIETDGSVWEQIADTSYFCTGYKAVAIPPHGRLIDADALIEQTQNWYCSKENCEDDYNGIRCRACWVDDAIGIIDDAPTVLEATE